MAEQRRGVRIRVYIFDHISSRNPFEVFAVSYLALSGLNWTLGLRPGHEGLSKVTNGAMAGFWNVSMLLFGLAVLVSYFIADWLVAKLTKMWCMLGMGASSVAYGVAFVFAFGMQRTLSAGWLILLGLACFARAGQVFREIAQYRSQMMAVRRLEDDGGA
jgi:hypothetical protein